MRLGRRSTRGQHEPGRSPAVEPHPGRPTDNILYSEYLRRRPLDPPQPTPGPNSAFLGMYGVRVDPLPEPVRHRLALAMERHAVAALHPVTYRGHLVPARGDLMGLIAQERLVEAWGDLTLRGPSYSRESSFQRLAEVVLHDVDAGKALDVIGAWAGAYAQIPVDPWPYREEAAFLDAVQAALAETRFAVRGRDMVLRKDLGAAVLIEAPTQQLIASRPEFAAVDAKLREALSEIDAGRTADAVTDAGTALQLLLSELGHSGPTLGDQVKSARRGQLFARGDTKLGDALDNLCLWVATVRNQSGDAHPGPAPDRADAEFVVRLVGLLLLRWGA